MYSLEELLIIFGIVAVTQHNLVAAEFEAELWQLLLWHYYYRHPVSRPLSIPIDWEAHLYDPNLADHDSYFRSRFRMSVPTVRQLITDLSPLHVTYQMGRPRSL